MTAPACIDVSSNNGTINWPQVVAAGVKVAIAKCSQGASPSYPTFAANWHGIRSAGIPRRGAYHYADARSSPVANATAAAQAIAAQGGMTRNDFFALDTERLSQQTPWPLAPGAPTISWTLETLAAMEQLTGRRPWLYCSLGWLTGMLKSDPRLRPYPLWIADINPGPIATPWPYALRQYTWTARVPGVGGNVDGSELGPAYGGLPSPTPTGGSDVLIATNPADDGYLCVDAAGHVFAYGVPFHGGDGSLMKNGSVVQPGTPGAEVTHVIGPVTGVAMTHTGNGYFMINAAGQIYAFGDAHKLGDPAGNPRT